MIILLVIFFLLFLLLFVPWSININLNIICDRFFLDITKINGLKNRITIKLCNILPVYSKNVFDNTKKKKGSTKKDNKFKKIINKKVVFKLLSKCYFEKFGLSLGFNVGDVILNSKLNAYLNTLICMAINYNQNQFNFKNLYYQTYISDSLVKLNFDCIIKISLENTIRVIGKEYFKMLKEKKQNSLAYKERSIYGRASN